MKCEARAGWIWTDYGEKPRYCHQWKGLRTFVAGDGKEHRYCAAPGHRHDVERQFGKGAIHA